VREAGLGSRRALDDVTGRHHHGDGGVSASLRQSQLCADSAVWAVLELSILRRPRHRQLAIT
jgi:hypothetical protein